MGLAFMYVRPELAERLEPAYPGWFGHESLMSFGDWYKPAPGARRFQQGSLSIEPIYTARAGLRLALELGVENIRARSLELTSRLIERADARGLVLRTPRKPHARGGGVCLDAPNASAVVDALDKLGIDVDYRQGAGVRVAPHYCHREDECDRVVDAIADVCRAGNAG
jgi:kynureninase